MEKEPMPLARRFKCFGLVVRLQKLCIKVVWIFMKIDKCESNVNKSDQEISMDYCVKLRNKPNFKDAGSKSFTLVGVHSIEVPSTFLPRHYRLELQICRAKRNHFQFLKVLPLMKQSPQTVNLYLYLSLNYPVAFTTTVTSSCAASAKCQDTRIQLRYAN